MSSVILSTNDLPPVDKSYAALYDTKIYRDLSKRSSLPPTPFMLLFMGQDAVSLYERRYIDGTTWWSFRKIVEAIFPDIPAHTSMISPDGQVLTSVPERIVYERLRSKLSSDISLSVHPLLPVGGRAFKADFVLEALTGRRLWIEAVGSVGRDFRALNSFSERCMIKLITKFKACEEAGVPLPFVIYADEICDREILDAAINCALLKLTSGAL